MIIDATRLRDFVTVIFEALGSEGVIAREVAEHLVDANLKGHDSHGVGMVPAYVHNLRNGLLHPNARVEVLRDQGAVVLFDARRGFGQSTGAEATRRTIARARQTGVACAGVRNAHHLGRIGSYGEQCAAAGMVSVHFVNVVGHEPQVAPYGGRARRMTTNPFCAVVPRSDGPPLVLDMASSAIALGKVRVAYMKGERVTEGALTDHEGTPTDDPAVMFEAPFGALGPFGGHKGYGLAVICEMLGGALAGAWTAQPEHPRDSSIINHMLMFVLDPAAFGGVDGFHREVDAMADYLCSTPPAAGFDRVRLPGEPERETATHRRADGIPIDDQSWAALLKSAEIAGVTAARITEVAGAGRGPG